MSEQRAFEDWRDQRNCAESDPIIFYPDMNNRPAIRAAKAICGACDVRIECQQYSITNKEEHGVWGGLDEAERRKVIAIRRRYPQGYVPVSQKPKLPHPIDRDDPLASPLEPVTSLAYVSSAESNLR